MVLKGIRSDFRARSATRDRSRAVLGLIAVTYVVRVVASGWRTGFPPFFPDSSSYIAVTRMGPFDPNFWFAERPVGVPLVLWMAGGNHRAFFVVQTLIFALSLTYLCTVLLKIITSRWLAWVAIAVVTAICIHPRFGVWHLEILSESLALSTSILLVAVWLTFASRPSRRQLVIGIAVTVAWMSIRDVHIVIGLVVSGALFIRAVIGRDWPLRKIAFIGAGVLVAFSSYVLVSQSVSDRNLYPLINNIGKRVLPNAEVTRTFTDRGMPIDDALRERTGADSWSDDRTFLLSADLEAFRSWADADGQRSLLTSLVVDAPFWIDTTRAALEGSLPLDFTEYDRYSTSERLPTRLFWFQGPRTTPQFLAWFAIALAALGVLAATSARRRFAFVGAVAVIANLADAYVSASGDSVEVQRHLLGSILRFTLTLVIIAALGAQEIVRLVERVRARPDREPPHERLPVSLSGSIAASIGAVGIFGSWVALEHRSQDFDPMYARTIVERAARFGGSYYENGIHNKGPIETALYDSVRLFTRFDTYWFGISVLVLVVSLLLGLTAWTIARHLSSHTTNDRRVFAVTVGALVATHFALSDADYAGVLYSRNITTALLALVTATTLWEFPWRKPLRATVTYLGLFVLLGLAIQTLLTTVFAATVVAAFVHARRSVATRLRNPLVLAVTTSLAAISTAPAWYVVRGSFAEYWSNWWTYAGYMSSSTGRSLLDQIGLGFQKMFGYYQERPGIALLIVVFVLLVRARWGFLTTSSRILHVMLLAWLFAGWIELTLSQRYSSHYFSVIAVPTAFIAVATAVQAIDVFSRIGDTSPSQQPFPGQSASRALHSWWVTIASVAALLAVQGTHLTWIAIEAAGRFRSTDQYVQARADMRSGSQETHQAVLDLVTSDDDPLLAWTMYPWTYLDHRRVPATRFSWKSFLIGEVYLGRTSPTYVLDRTWEWFDEDLAESRPRIYGRPQVTKLEPTTPFEAVVAKDFVTVFTDEEMEFGWRRDLWTEATSSRGRDVDISDLPTGWTPSETARTVIVDSSAVPWKAELESCQRLSTRLIRVSPADPMGITFEFTPIDSREVPISLNVDFDRSWSMRSDEFEIEGPSELHATVLSSTDATALDIILLVTPSAAALVVDDRIVSAVLLPGATTISILPTADGFTITTPTIGTLEEFTGC